MISRSKFNNLNAFDSGQYNNIVVALVGSYIRFDRLPIDLSNHSDYQDLGKEVNVRLDLFTLKLIVGQSWSGKDHDGTNDGSIKCVRVCIGKHVPEITHSANMFQPVICSYSILLVHFW